MNQKPILPPASHPLTRAILLSLTLAAFCCLGVSAFAAEPKITKEDIVKVKVSETSSTPRALVISTHGKSEFSTNGSSFQKLKPGQVLEQGATIRTGSDARTDIFFRRIGTTVRLQPDSEVHLEKMQRQLKDTVPVMNTLLHLRAGRIFTVVRSPIAGSTFEIRNKAGRSVVEGAAGSKGRYIITADGSQIADKNSSIPIKLVGDTGITTIIPGQQFNAKEGKMLPVNAPDEVETLIDLDELDSLGEQLMAPDEFATKP
jgi:hypothetical protein